MQRKATERIGLVAEKTMTMMAIGKMEMENSSDSSCNKCLGQGWGRRYEITGY